MNITARDDGPSAVVTVDGLIVARFYPGKSGEPSARELADRHRDQLRDMAEAHAEGMHADLPRDGCPECER